MNTVETEVLQTAEQIDPNAPVVQAAEAVVATIADPSPLNVMNDLELALKLAKRLKSTLSTMHPSVTDIIKALF